MTGADRLLGVLLITILTLFTGAPAHAEPSRAEQLALFLEESPVHVDPAYQDALPEETLLEVEQVIEESGLPVRVLLVPLVEGDPWGGDARNLAAAVHDHIGGEGHYLVLSDGSLEGTDHTTTGRDDSGRAHLAALSSGYATDFDSSLSERLRTAVHFAVEDDPEARYAQEVRSYEEAQGDEDTRHSAPEPVEETERGPGWPWVLGASVLTVFLLAGGYLMWTRSRPTPRLPQHAAFTNAERAHRDELAKRSAGELVEVGERISRAEVTGESAREALREALDAHAAARAVHEYGAERPATVDSVGVLVLLDLAEDALARARGERSGGERLRHCYANPLHGTDTTLVGWRQLGGERTVDVPLCDRCAEAIDTRMRPRALHVIHQGRALPYYEISADESVWAATGYGALREDLVERVLRGDHASRTR